MKKLIVFASTILLIFTACSPTSSDLPSEEVDTSNYSVNTEYLDEIALALENTYVNYESLELAISVKENLQQEIAIEPVDANAPKVFESVSRPLHYLISKEPYMGLSTIYNNGDLSFQDIYIADQDIEGYIAIQNETDLVYTDNYVEHMSEFNSLGETHNGAFRWYLEFENLINITSNPDFVVNTTKEGNIYTLVVSNEYFAWNKDEYIKAMERDAENLNVGWIETYENQKLFIEGQENNSKSYILVINDGVITQIRASEYFLSIRAPLTYELTNNHYDSYNYYLIDILRLNDNEAIQNEIQEVYDNALKD